MQSGFYSAAGGMVTQLNRLDTISNNLANANTNAFKRDDVVVGDFMRYLQEYRDELPLRNHTKEAAKFLNRSINRVPQVVEQYINQEQGSMQKTDNPLDFALKKEETFFMVETPSGLRLTRDGSFKLNDEGVLSTKEGYPVLPDTYFTNGGYIQVDVEAQFGADKMGGIYQNGIRTAGVFVATYDEIKELSKEGNNYYAFKDNAKLGQVADGDLVANGFVEKSNINPVTEMTALIETNRLVEMYQKIMTSHMTDMNQDAINKLAARA